jgi:arabinofuranosyltransferase
MVPIEIVLAAAFTYVFLANAWLGDDAYITFRVVWNVLHGYGPVFNPGERVQAYTHPLWMLVMTVASGITREFFFTSLAVSYAFALATVIRIARSAKFAAGAIAATLVLLSSKAFVDYTSSGLEYPLSYLLLASFYIAFLQLERGDPERPAALRRLGLLAGLAFVNRIDSVLLYAGPMLWLAFRLRHQRDRLLSLVVGFAAPVVVWLLFATWYYGFPLPNTYYAKVATRIPSWLMHRQGWAYVLNSFSHDPITLGAVGVAAALAVRSNAAVRVSAASALLYVLYTVSIGGDFMSGRFFAMPFLVAVITMLPHLRPEYAGWVAAGILSYNLVMPLVPIKTTAAYDGAWPWRTQNGIKDERGHYHQLTNVLFFSPFRRLPDHTWVREGLSFRNGPDKLTVQGSIGFYGFMAGPDKHIVDRNALSDPLLARLPVSPRLYFEFFVGHFFRDIPDGYLESLVSGQNQIADPMVHGYYDRLRNVVTGPLWTRSRLRDIWYLNVADGRRFAERYDAVRPIALSVRANNERFVADAGEKDNAAGVIRSIGRAGYLQTGPGIPMKRGLYRARWVGTAANVPGDGAIGFVDVWAGDRRIAKLDIGAKDLRPDTRQLAEVEFALPDPAASLEYRLWVDGRTAITLERVELSSVREIRSSQQ